MVTRKQFEHIQKTMSDALAELQQFHAAVVKQYKYHYSDIDEDQIIDSIDYGCGGMTYEQFKALMEKGAEKAKKKGCYDQE